MKHATNFQEEVQARTDMQQLAATSSSIAAEGIEQRSGVGGLVPINVPRLRCNYYYNQIEVMVSFE